MNGITESVIGGAIFAAIIEVVRRGWSRFVVPVFDQSVAIEGTWNTHIEFSDGEWNKHRIVLKRFGRTIWGTAVCVDGWGAGSTYQISGTFKNLILAAEYGVRERRRVDRGTFTLMLVEDGSMLRGHMSYFDNAEGRVESTPCEWLAEDVPSPRKA